MRRYRMIHWAIVLAGCVMAAGGARAVAAEKGDVVALPPFLVESSKGPPWRYAESPEFEILARCGDGSTREIAESYHRLHVLLRAVLPEKFQVKLDVRPTLMLYDSELLPATAAEMLQQAQRANPGERAGPADGRERGLFRNPRLSDKDAMTVFVSVPHERADLTKMPGDTFTPRWTNLTPGYVSYLIGGRVPALPPWFVAGFMGLYRKMNFSDTFVEVGAITWMSERETRGLRTGVGDGPVLLPLEEIFGAPTEAKNVERWTQQRELFVRWGLDDPTWKRTAAFATLVERASTEPMTEALFEECLGVDFARAREQLANYLLRAVKDGVRWRAREATTLGRLELREATGGEIARIKGDWERLTTSYVRANAPELEFPYLAQTRRTLRGSYDLGNRDPRLMASIGIMECEAGNDATAKKFLEQAVAADVVRPRAYTELARLRLAEAQARPAGGDGKLSAEQAAAVLGPLNEARRQAPPLAETYRLISDVWMNAAGAPTRDELAALDEGVARFRGDAELLYRTAWIYAALGYGAEAAGYAERGVSLAANEATRRKFAELKAKVAGR